MVIVVFKFLHPIDFSEVLSKAITSLKSFPIFLSSSFFFFESCHSAASPDPSLTRVFISHNGRPKEAGTLRRKNICPEWTQIGRPGLCLPFLHAPKGLNLVYRIYCDDINMLQEQESSQREKNKLNVVQDI